MALAIATNNAALNAAASASSVNRDMETSMARLSSGKRINSASDDAAGVAISSRLSAEIRGTDQAIRNSLDGQALIDTAEGAHKEIENILQRMREIAVQAANDTNNAQDRGNLQAEMDAMSAEIDRIAGTTTWAGAKLMEDATTDFSFQVGAATGTQNQISVDIKSMNTSGLLLNSGPAGITGVTAADQKFEQAAYTVTAAMFSNASDITTIAGLANDGTTAQADRDQTNVMASITSDVDITLTDVAGNVTTISLKANDDAANITALSAVSGVVATQAATPQAVGGSQGSGIKLTFATDSAAAVVAADAVEGVTQVAANINRISVEDSTTGADDADDNALASIVLIDAAIKNVNIQRSELGAVSNRLNHTVNNLTNISSNLSAAKGGIEDADFALETTNLAKNQILQQASTAMLAQANASKQNVLSLLQG
jgi:flagellin